MCVNGSHMLPIVAPLSAVSSNSQRSPNPCDPLRTLCNEPANYVQCFSKIVKIRPLYESSLQMCNVSFGVVLDDFLSDLLTLFPLLYFVSTGNRVTNIQTQKEAFLGQ